MAAVLGRRLAIGPRRRSKALEALKCHSRVIIPFVRQGRTKVLEQATHGRAMTARHVHPGTQRVNPLQKHGSRHSGKVQRGQLQVKGQQPVAHDRLELVSEPTVTRQRLPSGRSDMLRPSYVDGATLVGRQPLDEPQGRVRLRLPRTVLDACFGAVLDSPLQLISVRNVGLGLEA